jgi:hypothetical protein
VKFIQDNNMTVTKVQDEPNPQEYVKPVEGDNRLKDNLQEYVMPVWGDNCLKQSTPLLVQEVLREIICSVVSSSHIETSIKDTGPDKCDIRNKENVPPGGKQPEQPLTRPAARKTRGILQPSSNVPYIQLDIQGHNSPYLRTDLTFIMLSVSHNLFKIVFFRSIILLILGSLKFGE